MSRYLALIALALASQAAQAAPTGAAAALLLAPPDFLAGCRASLADARSGMDRLKMLAAPAAIQALEAYDFAQKTLGDAGSRAGLAQEVHPDRPLREAAENCIREVAALRTEFSLDRGVYDRLSQIERTGLDPASQHYLERTLQRFRLAGVDRDEPTRQRVRQLNQELTRLSQDFGKHIREGVLTLEVDPKDLDGLPADFLKARPPGANGKITLRTDNPDYVPVMSYARDAGVRETFWRLYRQRAWPANIATLDSMLARRHELAGLLGFANWADYITADKMIGNGRNAADFIEKIAQAAAARATRDYGDLLARKKRDDPAALDVKPWDTGFLTDRIKAERYGVDAQQLRPWFPYAQVKQGVLDTTSRMFGIRYQRVVDAPVWHPEVEAYDVLEGSRTLGRIYLDMHPRADKYKHYAHFRLASGKEGVALPESVLVCNFPRPAAGDPGLMEFGNVVTFFHEFGHLLHAVLGGHTKWAGLSGVATERDFVEAPSQLLEEWVRDPKILQTFALHHQTKQPLPAGLVDKLVKAEEFGKGLGVRAQMSYAATSLGLHARDPKGLDTTAFVAQMQERYTPFKHVPGTYFHTAFGHLDGYSAIYYTYMWSLVIAKDMFSLFKAQGDIMSPATALKYRRAVLEPGGSKPAAELVKDFLGRPYGFGSYEAWLNQH